MEKKHNWYYSEWEIKIGGETLKIRNALTDEGERLIANVFFRKEDEMDRFYVRLVNDTLDEGDTLASITGEPSGNGYSPQEIERSTAGFPTLEQHEGDWRVVSKVIEFKAVGGDIGPINHIILTTSADNTGKLVAYVPLPQERTIINGDIGQVRIRIKFK